jgi:hypothetical protein
MAFSFGANKTPASTPVSAAAPSDQLPSKQAIGSLIKIEMCVRARACRVGVSLVGRAGFPLVHRQRQACPGQHQLRSLRPRRRLELPKQEHVS